MPKAYTQITLRFEVDELERVDAAAKAAGMSRAAWIRAACEERIERQKRAKQRTS
jgi:hypothetical protein